MLLLTIGILTGIIAAIFIVNSASDPLRFDDTHRFASHDGYSDHSDYDPWDRYYPSPERRPHYEDYRRDELRRDELRHYSRRRRREDLEANLMTIAAVGLVVAAYLAYLYFGGH